MDKIGQIIADVPFVNAFVSLDVQPAEARARRHAQRKRVTPHETGRVGWVEPSNVCLVTRCIATRSKKLLVAPGITTGNKKLLVSRNY